MGAAGAGGFADEDGVAVRLQIGDKHLGRGEGAATGDDVEAARRIVPGLDETPQDVAIPLAIPSPVQSQIKDEAVGARRVGGVDRAGKEGGEGVVVLLENGVELT